MGFPLKIEDGTTIAFVLVDVSTRNVIAGMAGYAVRVFLTLLVLALVISWLLSRRMKRMAAEPINEISRAVAAYSQDKNNGKKVTDRFTSLEIRTGDELENLSTSLAKMEQDLIKYEEDITRITAEKERIRAELDMAAMIQKSQLPRVLTSFSKREDFDIDASMTPAKEIGGDFYDSYLIDEDHLCMAIADVSGKGIPAALFMMISRIMIKNRIMSGDTPAQALYHVNNRLLENEESSMFVTVWLCVFDLASGRGISANAGREHPALRRADGKYELVVYRHSPAVGSMENLKFREHEFVLNPGDSLFVYTDGVPEATNAGEELFGTERMIQALNQEPDASCGRILSNVRSAVDAFAGEAEQFDDLTMLCFTYRGRNVR